MRKKMGIALLIILCFTGCGMKQSGEVAQVIEEPELKSQVEELFFAAEDTDISIMLDNTQDLYQYTHRIPLDIKGDDHEYACPSHNFLSETTVSGYQTFVNIETNETRTIIYRADVGKSEALDVVESTHVPEVNQYFYYGPIWNSTHYLALSWLVEEEQYSYSFYELDENLSVVSEYPMPWLNGSAQYFFDTILMDSQGNIHLIMEDLVPYEGGGMMTVSDSKRYVISSKEGKVLAELADSSLYELSFLYDDKVAYLCLNYAAEQQSGEMEITTIGILDVDDGENTILAEIPNLAPDDGVDFFSQMTMGSENTVYYADKKGLYSRNIDTKEDTQIYLWRNHGLNVSYIYRMDMSDTGINLIVEDADQLVYLRLVPVEEKQQMVSIDFVCTAQNEEKYSALVSKFHNHFPNYHINLIADADPMALNVSLTSGEGPTLIDTELTGFEDLIHLWQPLDDYMDQIVNMNDIYEQVLECGKVDGTLYGIVDNFYIDTIVSLDSEISDWNYDEFLMYIELHKEVEAPINYSSEADFLLALFEQGLADNYFICQDEKGYFLQKDNLNAVLDLVDIYFPQRNTLYWGDSLVEGNTFGNAVTLTKPESFTMHRMVFGEKMNYVGYPHTQGSGTYISGDAPLCIRKGASEEEKVLSLVFMKYLLSSECQQDICNNHGYGLSIRKDVSRNQFYDMSPETLTYIPGWEQCEIGDAYDPDTDYQMFLQLLSNATIKQYYPAKLYDIFHEEIEAYEAGRINRETMIARLESRMDIYFSEMQ